MCRTALPPPRSSYGEAHCPRCQAELWCLALPSAPVYFIRHAGETIFDLMAGLADQRYGFTPKNLERVFRDADHLDIVELLATFENALRS